MVAIVGAAWMILQWGILPRLDTWRPHLAAWAGRSLGIRVEVGHLAVRGDLWAPVVVMRDLRITDPQAPSGAAPALRMAQAEAVVTPGSLMPLALLRGRPQLARLTIEGLHLALRRDTRGRMFLAGLPLDDALDDPDDRSASPLADWVFSQPEIRLRDAGITWVDERRDAGPLSLDEVSLDLAHEGGRHRLALAATPPAGWGARFTAQAEMAAPAWSLARWQHPGDWRQWQGEIRASWPHVDVRRLRRHMHLPFDLSEGRGRLDTRVSVSGGALTGAAVDLQLEAVTLRLAAHLPPLALRRMVGQLEMRHDPAGSTLRARGLAFEMLPPAEGTAPERAATVWPATDLDLRLDGPPAQWHGGAFRASLVDLDLLARSAAHVPLAGPVRRLLAATRPAGRVRGLTFEWQGDLDAPARWRARGDARDLHLAAEPATAELVATATPGRPGLLGAQVRFDASERGGRADVAMGRGALEFPGVFEQPRVELERLQADVRWTLEPDRRRTAGPPRPAVAVEVRRASFATADGEGEVQGRWRTGPADGPAFGREGWLPGRIDLHARVAHLRADRVHRYLPLGIRADVRHYLRDALGAGHARAVRARVRGDVLDFPYASPGEGEFRIEGEMDRVRLDAIPASPWPAYHEVGGRVVIDRQRLEILDAHARMAGLGDGQYALREVHGGIADFVRDPVLRLQGRGAGPLRDVLAFLTASPVDGWLGHPFRPATGDGRSALQLALAVPLHDPEATTLQGEMDLDGASLRMRPDVPALDDLHGRIRFTERGFDIREARATAAGGPLTFGGRLGEDGGVRFGGQGRASMQALRRMPELGAAVTRLAGLFEGEAAYRLDLDLTGRGPVVRVGSDLVGVVSRLPAPVGKAAESPRPMRVVLEPEPDGPATRLDVDVAGPDGAPLVAARLRLPPDDAPAAGEIRIGREAPEARRDGPGLAVQVSLAEASLDAWQAWSARLREAAGAGPDAPADEAAMPRQVRLRADTLRVQGQVLTGVDLRLARPLARRPGWNGTIEADQVRGQVEYQAAMAPAPARVRARLDRLVLARPAAAPGPDGPPSAAPAGPEEPLPEIDLIVQDFELAGRALGRLELEAGPGGTEARPGRPHGEWHLTRLALVRPEARLQAVGQWSPQAGRTAGTDPAGLTRLTFRLDLHDVGRLLDGLGWPGTLQGGRGHIGGQIHWPGSPLAFGTARLGGSLRLNLDEGQFLQADPGVARLLGVLSLQSLPRRFLLDFRDVFQRGFSFDHIDGDVQIRQGLASTRNLRIRGVQAMILTEGSASLAEETQQLHVWVVPDLNAGAASLAYAVINPAVGLGSLVTQWLLQRPLTEAATREFRITGRWDAPQVVPVDRQHDARPMPVEPAPDAAQAAPAPVSASASASTPP